MVIESFLCKQQNRYALWLLLLAVLLFFPGLGTRDFWAPVEPRYAEIARVMFAKGEWILPTINGDLYTDKPVLYFWLVLIASNIVGAVNEWTVRLPAALGALGVVLTTYFIGKEFFNARIGFVAGAVLATSARFVWEARWAHVDMVFGLFFVLTIYFAARSLLRKGNSNEVLYAYAFMALATLAKGLIGVVLPGLILVSFMVVRRDWRLFAEARLPLGIPIFLLIAAPWFLRVNSATDGKWLSDFIYVHHLQRFTAGSGHRQPFYYYFTTLPVDLMPWTVFVMAALLTYRAYRKIWDEPILLFFFLWFVVIFVFFSISNTKRDLYLLPLFPAAAMFIAIYVDELINGTLPQGVLYRTLALFFFHLLWAGALALPVAAWFFRRDTFWLGLPSALVMAAGGVAGVYFIHRGQPWKLFQSTALMMMFTVVTASFLIMPFLEEYKSHRPFSLEVKRRVPPTVPLYIYADTMNDFNFYTEREIIPVVATQQQLEGLLSQHPDSYLLVRERDFEKVQRVAKAKIIVSRTVGGKSWYLISLDGR